MTRHAFTAARFAVAFVAILLVLVRPAAGLSPARALTQAQHRIWQVAQGLPVPSVYAVLQTRDGYLWIGTEDGLFRFDGVRFTPVADLGDGVWVRGLAEAADGSLWVATDGGAYRWRDGRTTRFTTADGLPASAARAVAVDPTGTVWVATAGGLARYDQGRWAAAGPSVDVRAVAAGGGDTWSAVGAQARSASGRSIDAGGTVSAVLVSGDLWIGTDHGVTRVHDGVSTHLTAADGLADDAVTCLAVGSDGTVWVGTRGGLSRVRGDRVESFRGADGLSQSTVFCLVEDREGSLWVGTKHGLNQLLDRRAVPFTQSEGLPDNTAGPVIGDAAGTIWVGSATAGVCRFDGSRFTGQVTAASGLSSDQVNALADAADGGVWVGTNRGLDRVRDGRVVARLGPADGLPSADVSCLCRDGDRLWVGTRAGAVVIGGGGRASMIHRGPVRAICRRGDRFILATADAGVISANVDGGDAKQLDPTTAADAVYADAAGLLWIGTRGEGLRVIDAAGRGVAITPAQGLYDDDLYGIAGDDAGRLWVACSKGVFWAARADLLAVARGAARRVRCVPFSSTDAQRTVECRPGVQPAVWRARDGRLWFATVHGLLVFDPADFEPGGPATRTPPPTAIEEVMVDGRPHVGDLGRLPPGVRNVTFRYTAMTLVAPAFVRFQYQLEGFDKEPVDAGARREAYYTNLPPGPYRFRVTAVLPDRPGGTPATVAFSIAPRFYQRAWFWPVVASVAVVVAWAGYRARVRRLRSWMRIRHAAASAERGRIARELHDTLLQGFSGVTMEMQALSTRLADPADRAALGDVIRDAADCMTQARQSVAGLRGGATGSLPAALSAVAQQLTDGSDVRLRLRLADGPTGLSAEAEYQVARIAQEAVGNAVRHAAAANVEVDLTDDGGRVRLAVSDDGRGFDAGASPPAGHYGLIGMRERAAQIGAQLRVDSRPGGGTRVSVTVPAERA
jgi:signal transduction histidine kinase/ligand-binding sensor domain-containing protein